MNAKRISAVLVFIIICITSVYMVFNGAISGSVNMDFKMDKDVFLKFEEILKENFPFNQGFRELAVSLKYFWGEKKQNDIYISGDSLFKVIKEPDNQLVYKNTETIIEFAKKYRVSTYAMIIPTACAIKQQEVDPLSRYQLYNEKKFIEEIYNSFDSYVASVNVYPTLFANNDKYIYYKTESNLTGLGGYYVYEVLAKRFKLPVHELDRYEIQHYSEEFYGDIYNQSPYKAVIADTLSSYKFAKFDREYRVTRIKNGEVNTYYKLYPMEALKTGAPTDIFLGGIADKIEIDVGTPNDNKLLIYGDKTVMSYLPFLAANYKKITFINVKDAPESVYGDIDIKSYDQVLFAASTDEFMHSDCFKNLP